MGGSAGIWIFAVAALATVLVFGVCLYWASRDGSPRRLALALTLLAPILAGGLYLVFAGPKPSGPAPLDLAASPDSTPHDDQQPGQPLPAGHPSMDNQDMGDIGERVEALAARLKQNPDDLDGWLLLARSYTMMNRYADAADAYEHAQSRVMDNADLLVNWIDLRLGLNDQKFDARTYALVDHAVTLAPDDSNVMLLQAMADLERGNKKSAAALVEKLRQRYPQGTPERKDLDTTIAQWMPAIAHGEK